MLAMSSGNDKNNVIVKVDNDCVLLKSPWVLLLLDFCLSFVIVLGLCFVRLFFLTIRNWEQ